MKKSVSAAVAALALAVSAGAMTFGVDIGYLVDAEDEYVSVRFGHTLTADASLNHQLELEIGTSSQHESGFKGTFTPVTFNYRAETVAANKLGYYFGAGLGFARTKISGSGSGVPTISDSGTSFALQAFVGVSYQLSDTVALHAGAKYIWIDDVELFGTNADLGDDVALSGGISIKF